MQTALSMPIGVRDDNVISSLCKALSYKDREFGEYQPVRMDKFLSDFWITKKPHILQNFEQ